MTPLLLNSLPENLEISQIITIFAPMHIDTRQLTKQFIVGILFIIGSITTSLAQVPFYGATVGEHHLYGYHSVKFRPGTNNTATYTTIHYGITPWFSVGTDLTTSPGVRNIGYTLRVGRMFSRWFSAGLHVTPSFDLDNSHRFACNTTGLFLNGNIAGDSKLFWVSNTWHAANRDADDTLDQWSYLASRIPLAGSSIWPHIGIGHSWKFDRNADLAAGFFYVIRNYNFYLWGNDFFEDHPRVTVGVDFTF